MRLALFCKEEAGLGIKWVPPGTRTSKCRSQTYGTGLDSPTFSGDKPCRTALHWLSGEAFLTPAGMWTSPSTLAHFSPTLSLKGALLLPWLGRAWPQRPRDLARHTGHSDGGAQGRMEGGGGAHRKTLCDSPPPPPYTPHTPTPR